MPSWKLNFSTDVQFFSDTNDLNIKSHATELISHNIYNKIERIVRDNYPRREGLTQGIDQLKNLTITPQEIHSLESALLNYISKYEVEDPKYCKSFSNFLKEWRDYLPTEKSLTKYNWEG